MKSIVIAFALYAGNPFAQTIRCDVDNQIEEIIGVNLAPNFPPCGHRICDRHAKFDSQGRAICPIDGRHK